MNDLYAKNRLFFIILTICVLGFLAWYFSPILICVIISGVISIIGNPIVEKLDLIRIGKIKFPHFLSVIMTLLLVLSVVLGMLSFFIPLIVKEATLISSIDGQKLLEYYHSEIATIQAFLVRYGVLRHGVTPELLIKENITHFLDLSIFSNILSGLIVFTSGLFFDIFTILFLSFFFLLDFMMLPRFILLLVPSKYETQTKNVMIRSRALLSRYFTGLFINVLVMIASYAITLSIVGVKGALVIAFFAGIVNIIPYIGPLIAVVTGILLSATGVVSDGNFSAILPTILSVFAAMLVVIVLDNILYGPVIQGKSMKVHPVEIFLVIICAGSIGGVPAMIIAVPSYALLRIVGEEFFSQFRLFRTRESVQEGRRNVN